MKRGPVELGSDEEEGESESKVMNQIFGRPQIPKHEVFFTKFVKANIMAFRKTKILRPVSSVKNTPFTFFEFYTLKNCYL